MQREQDWQQVDQAIDWIHSLLTMGIKPGLKRMEWMLERLNHPHRHLQYVHIGGTNGKGSTLSFLRHVLQEAGYDVGTFTSPYIERFQNRIQLNGVDIPDEDLLALAKQVKPLADELATTELGAPTEFEVLTVIAILYFATISYPDIVLWEVGLGGRYDSTNVVAPILSIITNVGHDHQHLLGETIADIAHQKAGIIKSGVHVVTGVENQEALAVIKQEAEAKLANLYTLQEEFQYHVKETSLARQTFHFRSMFASFEDLQITMQGRHQLANASVAIMALELLKQFYALIWDEEHLRAGLEKASWIGRLETLRDKPLTMVDGAHNPEGMAALAAHLAEHFADYKVTVIFSSLQDKQIGQMLTHLVDKVDHLILTSFDFPRVAEAEQIVELLPRQEGTQVTVESDWYAAYKQLVERGEHSDKHLILFTGSLYFISEVRQRLFKT